MEIEVGALVLLPDFENHVMYVMDLKLDLHECFARAVVILIGQEGTLFAPTYYHYLGHLLVAETTIEQYDE